MKDLHLAYSKKDCEYIRIKAKEKFDQVRPTWVDLMSWASPHRSHWLTSAQEGQRLNRHIVDPTHIIAKRSYVAGFLEGNTSATRPWYRSGSGNRDRDMVPSVHKWLDIFTRQQFKCLSNSNFYHAAGYGYDDYGTVNTAAYRIDEVGRTLFFRTLLPGSYFVLDDAFGTAVKLVREFRLSVKALVDFYGKNGDWGNFSSNVKKLYDDGHYAFMIDVVEIICENKHFDKRKPSGGVNRKWVTLVYEAASAGNPITFLPDGYIPPLEDEHDKKKFLRISHSKRKPFIIAKSTQHFEYGLTGPTLDALGLIKSLNKKAISKDMAIEQILKPSMQGPADVRKSYLTTQSNAYIPLNPLTQKNGGVRPLFELNPAISPLTQDVMEMRQQVDKLYYADYLLYLTNNPKTRTAAETNAILQEQQLVIGPNLQSLNFTHNVPIVDYVMDFTLETDTDLPPPPPELEGEMIRPEFISVFAQAQRAADLPSIERYMKQIIDIGQINPSIFAKANVDKYADLLEDRLFLPEGLNNTTEKAEGIRQMEQMKAEEMAKAEQAAKLAGAAKDIGLQLNNNGG